MIQGAGATLRASKYDFFFGRVTSNPQNQRRALQNRDNLKQLGIDEAADGRKRLLQIFAEGLTAQKIKQEEKVYGIAITRKVEVTGSEASGAIEIGYFYRGGDLFAIPEVMMF